MIRGARRLYAALAWAAGGWLLVALVVAVILFLSFSGSPEP